MNNKVDPISSFFVGVVLGIGLTTVFSSVFISETTKKQEAIIQHKIKIISEHKCKVSCPNIRKHVW